MYRILTLNNVSVTGLRRLPRDRYEVASEVGHPHGIMLRSFKMHDMDIPDTVEVVARAGAGVNNIPVEELSKRGIPVFNAPGANANAVKELVIGGMLLSARNLCPAWEYVRGLELEGAELNKAVEAGKKQFVGYELPSRTLGVIGLGAIGVQVANTALSMGMRVLGFDPQITVERAWELSSGVEQARSLDDLVSRVDMLTIHVPLVDATRNLIDDERLGLMADGSVLLNFSRGGIVDEEAALAALDSGKLAGAGLDVFEPEPVALDSRLRDHPQVIATPHVAGLTIEGRTRTEQMAVERILAFFNGQRPADIANPAVWAKIA